MEAELRNGATLRSKIQEDLNAIQNRIIRWIDRFIPEFMVVFKDLGKMVYATLEMTPLPCDFQWKTPEELLFLYRQVDGMKSPQLPKAKQLVESTALNRTDRGTCDGTNRNRHTSHRVQIIAKPIRHFNRTVNGPSKRNDGL